MRKARYDMQQVICRNASHIGYSTTRAKPGYWICWRTDQTSSARLGRVMGRVAETLGDGENCAGWLAVMQLTLEHTHAHVVWVNPEDVAYCYEHPPHELMAWITSPTEWVNNKHDIARLIAMAQHGTTSDQFITTRNDPDKPYNSRPEYNDQYILK